MSEKCYIVNCYTCQHNGQETCNGCNTLLNGDVEPYQNWELREDLKQKDQRIAKLEQELAELKEKYIIPKFQLGQTIFTANKPNECIYELKIVSIHIERSEFCDRKFNSLVYLAERIKDGYIGGYSEEDLFATEQEAQAKLKEIQGNE